MADEELTKMDDKILTKMTIDEYFNDTAKRPALLQEECEKQIKNMPALVGGVKSNDEESQLKASNMIGNILTMNCLFRLDIPWEQLMEKTFLVHLVLLLYKEDLPQLQYEGVVIISKLAEESNNITALVCNGVIPALVDLLISPIEITRILAVITLGNIAKQSRHLCHLIIENKALEALLPGFMTALNPQDASRILRLFCDSKPKLIDDTVKKVLVVVEQYLNSRNEEILADACWSIASLSEVDESRDQVATNLNVRNKLIELLARESPSTVVPVLETMVNIMTRCEGKTEMIQQQFLDNALLRHLLSILLSKYDKKTNKNICLILSTISRYHAEDVVCYGFIYVLADSLETSEDDLKTEVVKVILSVTLNGTQDIMRLIGVRCIEILSGMLDPGNLMFSELCLRAIKCFWTAFVSDKKVALLENIKHDLGKIQKLQDDKDVKISKLATELRDEIKKVKLTNKEATTMFRSTAFRR